MVRKRMVVAVLTSSTLLLEILWIEIGYLSYQISSLRSEPRLLQTRVVLPHLTTRYYLVRSQSSLGTVKVLPYIVWRQGCQECVLQAYLILWLYSGCKARKTTQLQNLIRRFDLPVLYDIRKQLRFLVDVYSSHLLNGLSQMSFNLLSQISTSADYCDLATFLLHFDLHLLLQKKRYPKPPYLVPIPQFHYDISFVYLTLNRARSLALSFDCFEAEKKLLRSNRLD